jgi:hypothetical protein
VDRGLSPLVTAFLRARPDLLDTTEDALRRGETIACTPRSWERVSAIVKAISDMRLRQRMIAGTVGVAAAAEFTQLTAEIEALVAVKELLATAPGARAGLYPKTMNGLVGLIYALVAEARADTMPGIIEIMADLHSVKAEGLPLGELTSFGFEILIRKAMSEGLAEAFRDSVAYQRYAAERAETGAL